MQASRLRKPLSVESYYIFAGLLGALPFIAAGVGAYLGISWAGISAQAWLHSYAVAITGFMAGTLWGGTFAQAQFGDAVLGMFVALAVATTVWMPLHQAYPLLALLLATLWSYDLLRYYRGRLAKWYTGLRCTLSTVAIISVIAGWYLLP